MVRKGPQKLSTLLLRSLVKLSVLTLITGIYPSPSPAQTAIDRVTNSNPAPASEAYTLGAGDRISINILQVPDYSVETKVLVDGSLNLALAGSVSVQGMTLEQAATTIATAYSQFLRQPVVTVSLLEPRPLQIGVAGEVNHPGSYTLTLGESSQFPTLTQALATAGGITLAADLRQVQIRRLQRLGAEQVVNINLWELLQSGNLRYDITLRDGDTIFIPTATNVNLAEFPQLAAASFAANESQPINVAVVGEVYRPGPYTVTGSTTTADEAGVSGGSGGNTTQLPTVTRAIQVAGGIRPLANIRQIQIRRPTRSGTEQSIPVDLWSLLETGDLRQDVILQDGDTIVIPAVEALNPEEATQVASASFSPNTIRINVIGEVDRAGTIEVPPNTPLNQAILAAGGFNSRARRSSVDLVRLNVDGSVSRRTIPVDMAQGISEESNPALLNNDVVIVRRSAAASISDTLDTALGPFSDLFFFLQLPSRIIDLFDSGSGR
jgi:polysaccharide export outer membrane protein